MSLGNRLIWMFAWLILNAKVEAYNSGCRGSYCFVVSNISNSNEIVVQSIAQQRCSSNGTKLVEITSEDIQNSLVNFITSQGLNGWNITTNGIRSSGHWMRLNNNSLGTIAIYEQPDASYAYGYLKSTNSGFDLFASRPADTKGGFICSNLKDCSGGATVGGMCYRSYSETLSWYDARNRCINGGGDLASFYSITSNAGFNALNSSWLNSSNTYWIGFRREWWTWQTSMSDVKYSDWMTGHPLNEVDRSNSDCLCFSTTQWQWTECGCTQQLPFVCISDRFPTTPTTTTASTNASTTTRTALFATSTSRPNSTANSESIGVSSHTSPLDVLPNATAAKPESADKCNALNSAEVGLAVGLGVGIPLIIVIVALAVVIARMKKQSRNAPVSLESNQPASSTNQSNEPVGNGINEEGVMTGSNYETLLPIPDGIIATGGLYQDLATD